MGQEDYQDAEKVDEVNEKKERVLNVIFFAHSVLFDDQSRIVADESTNGEEEEVNVDVKQEFGSNE